MNRRQKIALWVGIGILVLMLLFPPFGAGPIRYGFFANPPQASIPKGSFLGAAMSEMLGANAVPLSVNSSVLATELIVAALVTIAAVLTLADKRAANTTDA